MKGREVFFTSILICMCAMLANCNNDDKQSGVFNPIDLEVKKISIDATQNQDTVNILGNTKWWILGVATIIERDTTFIVNKADTINKGTTFDRVVPKDTIEGQWYTIKKLNEGKAIYVNVQENQTNKERILNIELTNGNGGAEVLSIKQAN